MGVLSWARKRRARFERVQLVDGLAPLEPSLPEQTDAVFAIVAEAVLLQDAAEEVLVSVGRGEHLGLVAPRGGPLVRRFFALRDALPRPRDPWLQARVAALDTILLHHAMQVATSMEFLAVAGRSDRLSEVTGSYGGLGRPAELLDQTYAELRARRTDASDHVSDISSVSGSPRGRPI
ncbi:hypothetical protein [uncultured Friedmanniella sp.]|uniref:hypothetical protein n=1 Tax=uncultured Friedmanniella sp. TaxID=335381 RepID=UPI0035CB59DC